VKSNNNLFSLKRKSIFKKTMLGLKAEVSWKASKTYKNIVKVITLKKLCEIYTNYWKLQQFRMLITFWLWKTFNKVMDCSNKELIGNQENLKKWKAWSNTMGSSNKGFSVRMSSCLSLIRHWTYFNILPKKNTVKKWPTPGQSISRTLEINAEQSSSK